MIQNITQKIFLVLFAGLLSFQAQSQGMKERAADKHYDALAFYKAAEMYSELADKDAATDKQIRRAAECYRFIGDSENSETYYAKLAKHAGVTPEDFYNYAQMLKMNEKYTEANAAMSTFGSKASGNSIAKAHSENADYLAKIKSTPNKYTIAKFDVNTTSSDFGPSFYTKDGQTHIVFASARTSNTSLVNKEFQWDGSNFLDAYKSSIGVDGESTGVKSFDRGIKSKYHEGPVSFSNNGSVMYLTRSNYLDKKKGLDSVRHNNIKLYISTIDSNGNWGELINFSHNSDNYSLGQATVTEDGNTMYFSSDMPGGKGNTDIWMSKKSGSSWSTPVNMADINTEGRDMFPFIGKDGTMYFSTDGYAGLGGLDVYRATASGEGSFDKPENMMYPLNTNHDDFGLIIDQAQTFGYFSSNRDGLDAVGDDDIYRFNMAIPFKPKFYTIKGCAKNKSKEVVPNTSVKLVDVESGETVTKLTSASGCYEFENVPKGNYRIEASKAEWNKISDFAFNTEDYEQVNIEDANTYMESPECSLSGSAVDAISGEPLSGATVSIRDKKTGAVRTVKTDAKGQFVDPLDNVSCPGGVLDYEITIEKNGFFPKTIDFKHAIIQPGVVNLNTFLGGAIALSDAGNFCQINPILYDFNKSNIRPDAAVELNKLVKCMQENPDINIQIGSHTDCRATAAYNLALSNRRAKAVRDYVVKKGIDASRINGIGYGESKLLNNCACEPTSQSDCSDEQHQANRRTEFRIVSGGNNVKNNSTNSF
ncbi:OmpA family protein [Flavobacteriales bacterium]|nr:OmpA family protein [Flavobacteriales bacterium]